MNCLRNVVYYKRTRGSAAEAWRPEIPEFNGQGAALSDQFLVDGCVSEIH